MRRHLRSFILISFAILSLTACGKNDGQKHSGVTDLIELDSESLSDAQKVLEYSNAARSKRGAPALTVSPTLTIAAQRHATDMRLRNYVAHKNPEGETPMKRAHRAGSKCRAVAENIAYGQPTSKAVMQDWMASTGHRRNLLNSNYTKTGIARVGSYWVQVFSD